MCANDDVQLFVIGIGTYLPRSLTPVGKATRVGGMRRFGGVHIRYGTCVSATLLPVLFPS